MDYTIHGILQARILEWVAFPFSRGSSKPRDRTQFSRITQLVKNPPAMRETPVGFLGWEDPLEKGKATHFSILAWRIPWTTVYGVAKSWTRLSDFQRKKGFLSIRLENVCVCVCV